MQVRSFLQRYGLSVHPEQLRPKVGLCRSSEVFVSKIQSGVQRRQERGKLFLLLCCFLQEDCCSFHRLQPVHHILRASEPLICGSKFCPAKGAHREEWPTSPAYEMVLRALEDGSGVGDQGGIKCRNRGTGFLDSEGSHR